jgi:hypothetical protein
MEQDPVMGRIPAETLRASRDFNKVRPKEETP